MPRRLPPALGAGLCRVCGLCALWLCYPLRVPTPVRGQQVVRPQKTTPHARLPAGYTPRPAAPRPRGTRYCMRPRARVS